ncbi:MULTISPECIES: DUF2064 domain-containing protein [unclassified Pseudofrankia]|uniref:TIGR04282 family arsenosugar biosynthesis glycosyltransferase n=1 Tax=unclassified Pseudofrankia TaxID=2994372 RepID=UPI0008DA6821|nr:MULTISPECIES: DUF2064 domain-containing protein [unclassified Pseudofrankia]MDT3445830.1 DUF2064 domain-containing protein [Pseudofrankia sp. BMG5.37]OHV43380.1 glycosyltransferase [Pseudofrankia sp. BMG5.36]
MTARRPEEPTPAVTLLVVAKEPVPGRVKTRLTPPFTPAQAAAVAEAAIADTLAAVSRLTRLPGIGPVRAVLVLDGTVGPWLRVPIEVIPQARGPFDVRLAAAFDASAGPALLIGMDTPQVTPALLADACRALAHTDAVFGPAADGGWWALGLRRPDGRLLRGVATSQPDTGARQLERLARAGLRVATLPVLRDVDTYADADAVARLAPHGRFAAAVRTIRTAEAGTGAARPLVGR